MESSETTKPVVLVALDGSPAAATALPTARRIASQLGGRLIAIQVVPEPSEGNLAAFGYGSAHDLTDMEIKTQVGDPASTILRLNEDPGVALTVLTTHGRLIDEGRVLGTVAKAVAARTTQPVLLVRPEAAVGSGAHVSELKHLLLPVDGMPETAEALRPALELADRLGASIDLLYVSSHSHAVIRRPGSISAPRYVDQPQHEWPHWAHEMISHLLAHCGGGASDVPLRAFLTHGDVGHEIARFATEHRVDAIVLVRRSRLELDRAKVLRAVLYTTPCPALLIGGSASA